MRYLIIVLYSFFFPYILFGANLYNVKDYGVRSDEKVVQTNCLQHIIDECWSQGGGVIYFPAGKYVSATLLLRDNVTLHFAAGAHLIATDKEELYTIHTELSDTGSSVTPMLLYAYNAKNIKIEGQGKILAQPQYEKVPLHYSDFIKEDIEVAEKAEIEMETWKWKEPNVTLLYLSECENVMVSGVSFINSVFWTLHIHWCKRVNIDGIYIYSNLVKAVNADGIDIDGSENVIISNCIIETADDAICLKTTKNNKEYRNCENVIVTNCILTSSSSALKLGTESYGNFKYINFSNCIIRNTNRGIGIFVRDGGCVENVIVSNIQMECSRRPVGWWGSADAFRLVVLKRNIDSKIGRISNVLIKDVKAVVEGTSVIAGYDNTKSITDIKLDNIQLYMRLENVRDKRAAEGVLVKNVGNIDIENSSFVRERLHKRTQWTYSYAFQNVTTVNLYKDRISSVSSKYSPLFFSDCDNVYIDRCFFDTSKDKMMIFEGNGVKRLLLGDMNYYN